MRVFAPAKVNLHLAVGGMRADGFHDVTTILQALSFGDTVVITPDTAFGFACTPDLGLHPQDNLACRAAQAMAERFGESLAVSISVEKHIPAGAGLGGASADAAATIVGLAALWGVDDQQALAEVGRALGADVPFFLTGGAALFEGRGDVLVRSLPSLAASVVLAKPAAPVLTGEAYASFDRLAPSSAPPTGAMIDALEAVDAGGVAAHLYNNMTAASVGLVPEIAGALRLLAESQGVLGAAMAGSGSAVFGLYADESAAREAADAARTAGLWAVATHTRAGGCGTE